jgi:hypothetical protein
MSLICFKFISFTNFNAQFLYSLTLNLLTTTIVAPPSNASKWQMGFNSAFKRLTITVGRMRAVCSLLSTVYCTAVYRE